MFVVVADPVGSGFVETLSHPGGNITGFLNLEATLIEKWLELLKEIAPRTTRVAVMFNPQTASYAGYYMERLQSVGPTFGVTISTAPVRSEGEIETTITKIASEPNSGLIEMTDAFLLPPV